MSNYNFVVYNAEDLEKVGEVVTNHSISFDEALDLLGAERLEKEFFDDPDLRINGQEYWSGDLRMELADDYVDTLIYAGHPNEYDTETLATFVRNADAWDDPNVPECMAELAKRAGSVLWGMFRDRKADDMDAAMTATEDILSWIGEESSDDWDWDEKVWEASELLENLAKENSPYRSKDMNNNVYRGWESIATYIQSLLDVDLGI